MKYKCFESRGKYEEQFFGAGGVETYYRGIYAPHFNTIEFNVWNLDVDIPSCNNLIIHELGMCWKGTSNDTDIADVTVRVSADNYIYFNCTSRDICFAVVYWEATRLQKLDLWGRVVKLDNYCCRELNKLSEVHIPSACKVIGDEAFYRCNRLTKVNFEDLHNLIEIGNRAFEGVYVKELTLDSCKVIGEEAFKGVRALKRVYLPDGLERVGDGCFMDCNNLTEIRIPSTLKEIPVQFLNCGIFKEIEIPEGVKKINRSGITGIKVSKLQIPKSVKVLMRYCFKNVVSEEVYIPSELYQQIFAEYGDVKEYIGISKGKIIRY